MKGSGRNNTSCFKALLLQKKRHISGYNDLMNKSFITDLASSWNGQICARAEDLWVYQQLYPCTSSTIHSSPWHLPLCCLLQLESPLAIPAPSNPPSAPAPVGCSHNNTTTQQQPTGGTGSRESVLCARTPLPPLALPALHFFCLQIHVSHWSLVSRSCRHEHAAKQSFSLLLVVPQGLGLGVLVTFSFLLYLWVDSCDSVPVSPQCYKLSCRWWLYQRGVFHIHTAFSIKCVGIGSHQSNWTHARGMSWFNCYRWSYSTTKTV